MKGWVLIEDGKLLTYANNSIEIYKTKKDLIKHYNHFLDSPFVEIRKVKLLYGKD